MSQPMRSYEIDKPRITLPNLIRSLVGAARRAEEPPFLMLTVRKNGKLPQKIFYLWRGRSTVGLEGYLADIGSEHLVIIGDSTKMQPISISIRISAIENCTVSYQERTGGPGIPVLATLRTAG